MLEENTDLFAPEPRVFSYMPENSRLLRVLVVDDELLIRWSIAETLTRSGHQVQQAADGASALTTLQNAREPIDAVILDYRLPDSNDFELLSKIRQLSPKSPVILITAHGSADIMHGAMNLGVYAVVAKPFDVNELRNLLHVACAR